MIKIAICDDETEELNCISEFMAEFKKNMIEIDMIIQTFQSAQELLKEVDKHGSFDIYIMDIIMPGINGIELGERIREIDKTAVFIFLTYSPDFALDSYRINGFQYLLKPIQKEQLIEVLKEGINKIQFDLSSHIMVRTKEGVIALRYYQIIYVEYMSHSLKFHLLHEPDITSVMTRDPFDKTVRQLLQDKRFLRTHVSFVVNMDFVKMISKKSFELIDASQIPISKKNYADVKKRYIDYLIEF